MLFSEQPTAFLALTRYQAAITFLGPDLSIRRNKRRRP